MNKKPTRKLVTARLTTWFHVRIQAVSFEWKKSSVLGKLLGISGHLCSLRWSGCHNSKQVEKPKQPMTEEWIDEM